MSDTERMPVGQRVPIACALGDGGNPWAPFYADGSDGCLTIRDTNGQPILRVEWNDGGPYKVTDLQ